MVWLSKLLLALNCSLFAVNFDKQKIKINDVELTVEVAKTQQQLSRGLMDRQTLNENEGMLFIFEKEEPRHFWMKNTFVALSIGFFDKNKVLVDIQDMEPVRSTIEIPKTYSSKAPAKYALEVNRGWFSRHKIKTKAKIFFVETTSPK